MAVVTQSSTHGVGRFVGRVLALTLAAGALATTQLTGAAYAADPVAGGQTTSPPDSLFPEQGNSGYDVSHYDIKFKIDLGISPNNNVAATTTLSDSTTSIQATTTGSPLSSFSFDFQGTTSTLANSTFNVDEVTVNGQPATFTRIENTVGGSASSGGSAVGDKHKLIITPATPVDGAFTTVVTTSGRPVIHTDTDDSLEGWNNTVDGASFVNQPIGAMTLFPNNNTPRDKATYTWTVDAPTTSGTSNLAQAGGRPYQTGVVSNGELESRTLNGDGTRTTWVWDQKEQQASELSFFSIGRYDIYTSNIALASGRTIPEWTFIDPAITVANQTTTLGTRAQLKAMLDFYETKYGPYPGNSTGLVTDNTTGINYALETQDRRSRPTARAAARRTTRSCTSGSATRSRRTTGTTSGSTRARRPTRRPSSPTRAPDRPRPRRDDDLQLVEQHGVHELVLADPGRGHDERRGPLRKPHLHARQHDAVRAAHRDRCRRLRHRDGDLAGDVRRHEQAHRRLHRAGRGDLGP